MTTNTNYATRTYTIQPGGFLHVPRKGDFLTCLEASAPFSVQFDDKSPSDFEAGLTFKTPYLKVTFKPQGSEELVIKVGFGVGDILDSRQTLSGEIITTPKVPDLMQEQAPVTVADGANVEILPANPRRKEALIVNQGAGIVYVSTNPANVAGRGVPVAEGQAFTLEQTGTIFVRNDSGAAVDVSATDNGWAA